MICYDGEGVPEEVQKAPNDWVQDEDVLDTWFSSALWPFAALGWPEKTPELKRFYPNAVLVTGHDILFFWVARMLMMGEYAMGETPFPQVFLNGLIYGKSYWRNNPDGGITYLSEQERKEYDLGKPLPKDVVSKWEKMSKSKGNIIDPIEIIDEYGTDALRMALCSSGPQSREIDLDRRRFEEFKNFANKVWNGARFVFMNLEGDSPLTAEEFASGIDETLLNLEDRWILSALNRTAESVNRNLELYEFDQAATNAYNFFWKEFCAYYVEIAKPVLFGKQGTSQERKNKQKLLAIVLLQAIRLLHPMAPFITEELFQIMKAKLGSASPSTARDPYTREAIKALQADGCIVAPYPIVTRKEDINPQIDATFNLVEEVIYTIRNIRGEMKLPPSTATDVYIVGAARDPDFAVVKNGSPIIQALVRVNALFVVNDEPKLSLAATGVLNRLKIVIPIPEELIKQEKLRLNKEKERLALSLEKIKSQLGNEEFVSRAPPQLIEKQKEQLAKTETELREVTAKLQQLEE